MAFGRLLLANTEKPKDIEGFNFCHDDWEENHFEEKVFIDV